MGSFDAGNFDNDAALDARQEILDQLIGAIQEFVESDGYCVEDTDSTMAYVDMLATLLEHTADTPTQPTSPTPELLTILKTMKGNPTLDLETVTAWKHKILQVYDDEIDDLMPDPEYTVKRREIIETTLTRLQKLCS